MREGPLWLVAQRLAARSPAGDPSIAGDYCGERCSGVDQHEEPGVCG